MFESFVKYMKQALAGELPGADAYGDMVPASLSRHIHLQPNDTTKPSSVLMLIYPDKNEPHTIFIKRQEYKGVHSGQISLPGGKKDPTDTDMQHTALREAWEEIGLDISQVDIIGKLSNIFIDRSNHLVHPYVGITHQLNNLIPDPREVNKIIHIPVKDVVFHPPIQHFEFRRNGYKIDMPYYPLQGEILWGATAMMVSEFIAITRPYFNS